MQCNPKKCKSCGMWWTVHGTDPENKPFKVEQCGYKAQHAEQCKTNALLRLIVKQEHDTKKTVVMGLISINAALRKQGKLG